MNDGNAVFGSNRSELRNRNVGYKSLDGKIAAMNFRNRARARADCAYIIFEVRAIRRSNLDESRAAATHDVGNAKTSANFHELAARDDYFTPASESAER